MDIQKEREAFERFKAKQTGMDYETLKKDLDDCEKRFPNNRYAGWNFKSDWEVWQAATAQGVPEGFVLVPKEPTTHQVDYCQTMKFRKGVGRSHKFEDIFVYKAMIEAQEQGHE